MHPDFALIAPPTPARPRRASRLLSVVLRASVGIAAIAALWTALDEGLLADFSAAHPYLLHYGIMALLAYATGSWLVDRAMALRGAARRI